jgi:hypothetical protein
MYLRLRAPLGCHWLPVGLVLLAPALAASLANDSHIAVAQTLTGARVEFNRDLRPILSENCFQCHGPDESSREAGLRLDIRAEAVKVSASGQIPIVGGRPNESELVRRVFSEDPDERMPPLESHKSLTREQRELLKRWIKQGAEYQEHWSFEPPVKADIPAGENAVDALVHKRLCQLGMVPSPAADRRTLIRRLYFDILGLPPTPQEVTSFANDHSPDAYEQLVDRVLANPHYGERMALGWLDVVRFADTIGYHSDEPQNVWPYRDWVIRAFNENKPFDQFTKEQIAGDLLPNASRDTRIGSAFNRLLLTTVEGGAQAKDYEARMLTDRVRAVGAVWLGLTTGCAQCHDHKFDPFTTRDFYALGAFFADIEEAIIGRREDGMLVATPEEEQQLAKLDAALTGANCALDLAQESWVSDVAAGKSLLPELEAGSNSPPADNAAAESIVRIIKKERGSREAGEQQTLQAYFRTKLTSLAVLEREALARAEAERRAYYVALPKVLVSKRSPQKRIVRLLPRGNWMDETGEVMQPALPQFLRRPNFEDREVTRLELAEWLVSRQNPLTARTVINRLWQQFFGTGLSRVLDDLGAQGEPPTNPELLDWLASEFMDSNWNVKHMVRVIVTSETYQQVSKPSAEQLTADPANREFARQSRFRLEAELVRDNALAVAGLLSPKIGGPSAKPYQPAKYWENLNFPPRDYVADQGENQYRRGLYTWRQRTFPHPSLLAFDAPSREACAAERVRSNIPQQALVLLNDPTYAEAARAFAARIVSECNGTTEDRIAWAWEQALQRVPTEFEIETARHLFEERFADYQSDPVAAEGILHVGIAAAPDSMNKAELAAWTHVARVLLNLHETITRS